MIRYSLRPADWRRLIDEAASGWQARADERTANFVSLGRYQESSSIWGQIKRVYMEAQGFKCGFCERLLEHSDYGNVEHDVEHFRPKARVDAWPTASIAEERGLAYDFSLGTGADNGYFRLAYHPENYLISCKTCNSALKRNYFPMQGPQQRPGSEPRNMQDERPLLIYPIGTVDQHDPERLIRFNGVIAEPIATRGFSQQRARVTIDFFQLNEREGLLYERAERIFSLYLALEGRTANDATQRVISNYLVEQMTRDHAAHANAARCFRARFEADPAAAQAIAGAALEFVVSLTP